jgi:hypothetical protein
MGKNVNIKKNLDSAPEKKIRIFTSFEEAEASEMKQKRNMTPLERLAATVLLIKKIYNYKPQKYHRIFFDKV